MTAPADTPAGSALNRRLITVREVLGHGPVTDGDSSLFETLLDTVEKIVAEADVRQVWLLLAAMTGALPEQELVDLVRRGLALRPTEAAVPWLLGVITPQAHNYGDALVDLRVVTDRPVVDLGMTAKSDFVTGIQRVVRGVARQWVAEHQLELAVWTARGGAYRALSEAERGRIITGAGIEQYDARVAHAPEDTHVEIIVPWGVPVVVTEVPQRALSSRLAATAACGAASIRLVGYDCIPVSSAETVDLLEPEKFTGYLELVKHADRLAGISRIAAAEFEGFNHALGAQGLSGPIITACPLPHHVEVTRAETVAAPPDRPLVMTVGSMGRRKNQVAIVEAAEMLWRDGLDFELRLLGHLTAERSPLRDLIDHLQALGRPVAVEPGVSDARIAESLDQARCLVFPSLHEGFGLPVVEALTHGVPVIVSDFGSLREVAEGQGGILVDPEDVFALAESMRALVLDDDLHARLVAEARDRPVRTWREYGDDLWQALVS